VLIEDYDQVINQFETLLQKVTANMASGVIFEKLPPKELWNRSEEDVTTLQALAEEMKEFMLTLKPERALTIETRAQALLTPLSVFREILFRKSDDPLSNSRLALEELGRGVMDGSAFLDIAKEVKGNPSEGIVEILKLKEVHDTKEYLSAIPVPEATYARFKGLKKDVENLRLSISNLERSIGELRKTLNTVVEEISKFRPHFAEASAEPGSEPSLVLGEEN
jgi:hypothetical protein